MSTTKVKVKKKTGKGAISLKDLKDVKQLKGASYNPRIITDRRLKDLEKSLGAFGDLSGVVFNNNVNSGVMISGHQRISSIKGWKTRIEVQQTSDDHGTVGLGFIHATSPKGKKISIPLRVVDWSDKKAEFAANIAANAHGGEFDNKKLAKLVEKLDMSKMPSALIGLDPLHIRGLQQKLIKDGVPSEKAGRTTGTMNGASGQFNEATVEDVGSGMQHKCPRCNFSW